MANVKLNSIALALAVVSLLAGERSCGELRIVIPDNYELELTEKERVELPQVPGSLVHNASELLMTSIKANDGDAWLLDQRDDLRNEYPLMMLVIYPKITVNEYRTVEPMVVCGGSYDPVVWEYCLETSDTYLDIPGYRQIHIDHVSITADSAQEMLAFVEAAKLETPTGSQIAAVDVHNILYNTSVGLYHIIGDTPGDEYFSIKLRRIEYKGVAKFEISDWSCR
ncbi:MAG: hypothetical protein EX272_05230 [Chromatiales bacterium]|nr:MAG: hypothetical protein EX272_05230 [Chromatiales bacterium]